MSELSNEFTGRENFRWLLLTTVSAASLLIAICPPAAFAEDGNRPRVWIELGSQLEALSEAQDQFAPAFLVAPPPLAARPWGAIPGYGFGIPVHPDFPSPFAPVHPLAAQKPPHYAFGGEGKLSYQPGDSDWTFSASVRYGRSSGKKTVQRGIPVQGYVPNDKYGSEIPAGAAIPLGAESLALFDDSRASYDESHMTTDFQVGRDVGLGLLGRGSSSVLNFGVRFAQFVSKSAVRVDAIPNVLAYKHASGSGHTKYSFRFQSYSLRARSDRSFHGVGPSLSWNASAPLFGNGDDSELMLDWGINGALLFGRQKVDISHHTSHHDRLVFHKGQNYDQNLERYNNYTTQIRAKSVTVPNVGAFAGFSIKFPNAKVSLGYRADFFFGAMDAGIDTRRTADMSFHGPFAKFSVGLGG